MKRYVIAAGVGAACIGVVLGVAALLPESAKARFDRVEFGMTMEAVEATLGTPPDDISEHHIARGGGSVLVFLWVNADGSEAEIFLDEGSESVCDKRWHDSTDTIGQKIRRWVRWPW